MLLIASVLGCTGDISVAETPDRPGLNETGVLDSGDTGTADTGDGPQGDSPPPFPSYSGGACPTLTHGTTSEAGLNTGFQSSGQSRDFRLLVPSSYDGSRPMPLIVGYHWLNASSNSFVSKGEMESAIEEMDIIAVFPDDVDDAYLFNWPFFEGGDGAEKELVFFDDLLACIDEQFNIDHRQVHGIGVSAGALWMTWLSSTDRVDHLATVMSLSGGLGEGYGVWEMDFTPRDRKFPAFVLNGGASDWLGIDFYAASQRYRDALLDDGHFVVYCEHGDGHAMPPMQPPVQGQTTFYALWQFMLDHPYGTPQGTSPYAGSGLPDFYPEWCAIPG